MIRSINHPILRSSIFSISASAFGYLFVIFISRSYSKDVVSEYLLANALALALVLIIDCAADQCLVHYAKVKNYGIYFLWKRFVLLKLILVLSLIFVLYIWSVLFDGVFLWYVFLLIVPAFYMGPVFEFYGRNIIYAQIMAAEKLLLLSAAFLLSSFVHDFTLIIYACFFISLVSICVQWGVLSDIRSSSNVAIRFDFWNYIVFYYSVYIVLLSQLGYGNASRLVVESKLGADAFVSFTLALQVVGSISMVQSQVDRHMRPLLIDAIRLKCRSDLLIIVKKYVKYYLVPVLFLCIFLYSFAKEIIGFLYGENWVGAVAALQYSSPLLFTIASMRLVDIFVVASNSGRFNLYVNLSIAFILMTGLLLMQSQVLFSYIFLVVFCQFLHVIFMFFYLHYKISGMFVD